MTVVLVHGSPETSQIWEPLRAELTVQSIAPGLPGFGVPRPVGFTATKDAYAMWLADIVADVDPPVDLVGHDFGALITLRVATGLGADIRSYAVDVANIFHPNFSWPDYVRRLQAPGVGEEMLLASRTASPEDPQSTAATLRGHGVPSELAREISATHDEVMSQSILDFYRSLLPMRALDGGMRGSHR
jgi:pimeloyl-ACP methyl ester carboxylesterase